MLWWDDSNRKSLWGVFYWNRDWGTGAKMLTGDCNIWVKDWAGECPSRLGDLWRHCRNALHRNKQQLVKIQLYRPHPYRPWISRPKVEPVNWYIYQGPLWCWHCRSRDLLLEACSRSLSKSRPWTYLKPFPLHSLCSGGCYHFLQFL